MTTDLQSQLQANLGTAYAIRRELGRGGMSRVFLAEDLALGRNVVVKVLAPDLSIGVSLDRFRREIAVTARLQHPRIVPIFSAGELDGLPYYTMPFVEGQSLRERIREGGALPIAEAIRIMRDVADTLVYAHERGIVHRDIKPDNVLLSAGGAMVVDFGVAKALSESTAPGHGGLTSIGFSIGTPAYMAPEQAAGDTNVDHRADIYSLGATAYEMFCGQMVFGQRSAQGLITAHIIEQPKLLTLHRAEVPEAVVDLVMRCLAKDPADRPQRSSEIVDLLDGAPRAIAPRLAAAPSAESRPSIAVLPFANLSADPDNEYLSDGITEEILNALARVPSLRVAARTSSFAFKKKDASVQEVGRALNTKSVLEGSVRRAGNRLRVGATLVSAEDGFQIWNERYDRELKDIFDVQDEIAQAIVEALKAALFETPSGSQVVVNMPTRPRPRDLEAYELYLKGRHFLDQRSEGMQKAMEYYRRALERDPGYALAHAGVAEGYFLLTLYSAITPREGTPKSVAAAKRALELDPTIAEAHVVLANASLWYDWDLVAAKAHLDHAIKLKPSDSLALSCYAYLSVVQRKFDEALEHVERAIEIDPLGMWVRSNRAIAQYLARRFKESIESCRELVELAPGYSEGYRWMALSQLHLGQWKEAFESIDTAVSISNRHPWPLANLGGMLARAGRREEALAIKAELERRSETETVLPFAMATLSYGLGDLDATFEWLERSFEARDFWLVMLGTDPGFSGLRKDPRYPALAARIGLEK